MSVKHADVSTTRPSKVEVTSRPTAKPRDSEVVDLPPHTDLFFLFCPSCGRGFAMEERLHRARFQVKDVPFKCPLGCELVYGKQHGTTLLVEHTHIEIDERNIRQLSQRLSGRRSLASRNVKTRVTRRRVTVKKSSPSTRQPEAETGPFPPMVICRCTWCTGWFAMEADLDRVHERRYCPVGHQHKSPQIPKPPKTPEAPPKLTQKTSQFERDVNALLNNAFLRNVLVPGVGVIFLIAVLLRLIFR